MVRPVINFWGEFWQRGQECFWEKKSNILFSSVNFRKKRQNKNCQSFETTKIEKIKKQKKHWFRHYQSKTHFIFIFR
jgi:hypothetical protein